MNNYTIWGLFGPATWPAWLALVALIAAYLPERRRQWARRLLIASVGLFLFFAVSPLGHWLARPLEQRFPPATRLRVVPNHIVVLAGAEDLKASAIAGRPEVTGAGDRLIRGAALAYEHAGAKLWTVGGVRRNGRADIALARETWLSLGVPVARIGVIDGTLDTCANARGVAERKLEGPIVLVTSAMHMPRAVACFNASGVRAIPYPVDYTANASVTGSVPVLLANLGRTDAALHEWIGLADYRLRGRTHSFFP